MRLDNLKRHFQSSIGDPVLAGQKRARLEDTEIKSGAKEADHQPRNLKIQKLVNEIINNGVVERRTAKHIPSSDINPKSKEHTLAETGESLP